MVGTVTATAGPLPGAIFTTNATCNGTNINIFGSKNAVYLDGGPASPGAAGLPNGYYYVKVTAPDGTLLGTSGVNTPVHVTNGEFDTCYQLWSIVTKASDASTGFDNTTNAGGEYKVWVSMVPTFDNDSSKTDNFKVKCSASDPSSGACGDTDPPATSILRVRKFYDANANGINDDSQNIAGWKMRIVDSIDFIRFTPVNIIVEPDVYTVTEADPIQTNWIHTTPNPVQVTLASGDDKTVYFGNVCVGAGGGLTLGFWSNKNGQALFNSNDLAAMVLLNLRNANGSIFDPANYASFKSWLLAATATNMANMLSAQLAAMGLNVRHGFVSLNSLVYAPGLLPFSPTGLNALGFISINDLSTAANTELGLHGYTPTGDAYRSYQEQLKNALDKANNNLNFVQGTPCLFTFN
jgi:hypothetical protein